MKESFWGYLILLFGIFVIVIMMIIRDYQTTNDQDYYIMKEVTQAAMIDAIDYAYYREHNDLRIIEDKFAENFLRRFAQSMSSNKTYKIELFEISENPPKVSVRITTATGEYIVQQDEGGVDFGVVNILSAILDMKHDNVIYNNDGIPNANPSKDDTEDWDGPTPTCATTGGKYDVFTNTVSGVSYKSYSQIDEEWVNVYLSNHQSKTIGEIGCWLIAEATILSAYDTTITPLTINENRTYTDQLPSQSMANLSDGNIRCTSNWNITEHLKTGQPAIIQTNNNLFSSGDHYMALLAYDSSTDMIYVGNTGYKGTYGVAGWYKRSEVLTNIEQAWTCELATQLISPSVCN